MGFVVQLFSFVFLIAAIAVQTVSFLTSYMYENTINTDDHEGIFRRCGLLTRCFWWDRGVFNSDPKWLQAITILAIVSGGLVVLLAIFGLIALVPKFKSRRLNVFLGVLLMFNAVLLAAIVTLYTTLNDFGTRLGGHVIKFTGGSLHYSWSYWLLYGAIGCNLLASIFFCCNQPVVYD